MRPEDRLTQKAQSNAASLNLSIPEAVRLGRMARPITHEYYTHRFENFLFRKGEGKIHAIFSEDESGASKRGKSVSRHLLISARDSIHDLLIEETPQAERENAEWVLEEIRKELG